MTDTQTPTLEIHTLPVGDLESNCYLVVDPESRKALLVDPGGDGEKIERWVSEKGADVEAILITHGHADHIGALEFAKEHLSVPVGIHQKDSDCLSDPMLNLSAFFSPFTSPEADFFVEEGAFDRWSGPVLQILHTPGHSPGSISILGDGWVICGDVLFKGSIGRTDFPRSSLQQIHESIREKLMSLPPDTVVYPGHGPSTTIGEEKESNPFLHLG
ncbi:MAG: MBL fold metallo-hydrolase [Candidatus Omnitrophica bacterium]|nr:MBL fold metallo-hydrolase [Candidatus Omnitrophota bacterium]MCA9423771.1 MBL fold metallo-hydrolase [Candidatus Omnitrophota bacterium]MCA9428977.1 MBL fold metallo-hydrolase [Candidatus Omnitrophota bacterium]MCA9434149.1 MBL fold metallo-hydrolase [Candidatus Omnitrophota bacterium]MCA9441153.1 MBL fold metallo-hydrolase [Candidatus Omnitrophota bacterium]